MLPNLNNNKNKNKNKNKNHNIRASIGSKGVTKWVPTQFLTPFEQQKDLFSIRKS